MVDPRTCQIHSSIDGGTELWIQSSMEPPNAHWMEGRHTPKLPTEWWSSRCKSAAWTLLGHQLMDNEIGGGVKRAFLPDPDFHDAGYWSRLSFAALCSVFLLQEIDKNTIPMKNMQNNMASIEKCFQSDA